MNKQAKDLLEIFQAALDAVAGKTVVEKELTTNQYPESFHVVAIGKAADAMLQGVASKRIKSALLISKHGHISDELQQNSDIICIESDHPIPKEASLIAGQALLDYLKKLPEKEPCLFLISGGTSSLVEVLQDGWDLAQLQKITDYLLANAYSINEINAIRQRISKIKGGGLWSFVGNRPVHCLMISDVPDNDPAIIGSGLLFLVKTNESKHTPPTFLHFLNLPDLPPYKTHQQAEGFNWKIIASLSDAKNAAVTKAESLGYRVKIVEEFLEGCAEQVATSCVKTILSEQDTLFIWGGETTVQLPENPGKGGRNQHLALAAAIEMSGYTDMVLLAAGTDGSDGVTTATGALVDGQTVARGKQNDLNAQEYLQNADSNNYFQRTGGLIITGATGTNVMDLVIGIKRA